ncbi:39S ribosomal protein L1, mitochondrial-like [Limulus polyphemus]|uniref:39S ribosomal protein L1, mitochondrial-like n=1 Tax=Limulus polyphemus TaxID=6850 RepID=A0ABM1BGC5_LIMPO|nr:39S ribosomal protein L1, mitochondrial-like [Limulus polyphemus]
MATLLRISRIFQQLQVPTQWNILPFSCYFHSQGVTFSELMYRKSMQCISLSCIDKGLLPGSQNQQVRYYAARRGKREKMKATKKSQKKEVVKKEFVPYHIKMAMKNIVIKPRRENVDHWLKTPPIDDVWRAKFYKKKIYSVMEAIEMHRETHHPTILNEPEAILSSTIELDMRMPKKNRYLDNFTGTIKLPYELKMDNNKKKVLVFCKDSEDQTGALKAGAFMAGSSGVIKQIQTGELTVQDFDHVVAHIDMLAELGTIRGLLKKSFPNRNKGNLGTDIVPLVELFVQGVDYKSNKDEHELDFGWVDVPIGRLNMETNELQQNLFTVLNQVETHKPKGVAAPFITRVLLFSEPSQEKFVIPHWEYLEGYKDPNTLKSEEVTLEQQTEEDDDTDTDEVEHTRVAS